MSPPTFKSSGVMGGGASVAGSRSMGGARGASSTVPLYIFSTSSMVFPAPAFVPLAQPSANSDSTSDVSAPVLPPTTSPPVITIKDKASDLGLKDITDKDSWTEAKIIIDAHLHCHPYCPGPDSKLLVTSKSNAVASDWWEEVINYYVKPPISDLFFEESRFDKKGFEMIEHIDKYFDPSGTVNSISHIFDLINIKQAQDELVITLKAHFSHVFASLRRGGVAIDLALQVGFMLRVLLSSYHRVVQDFHLGCHYFKRSSTNVLPMTKTRGKAPSTKLASQFAPPPPMPLAQLTTKPTPMKPWCCACLVSMSHAGTSAAKKIAKSAWSATIRHTSLSITPRTAPSSNNSVSSWSSAPQPMAAMQHLVSGRVRPPHPLLPHPRPLVLLTGVQLAYLGRSRQLQKRIATTPARSLITRASMKDLCTTNLSPTFLFILMPPMPLLNLSTPPLSPRPTAAAPHHPLIPKASKLSHYPITSSHSFGIPWPTPPHSSLAMLTVSSFPTLGPLTT